LTYIEYLYPLETIKKIYGSGKSSKVGWGTEKRQRAAEVLREEAIYEQ